MGYSYIVIRGQKGYNGVAVISRLPITDHGSYDFVALGQARHVSVRLPSGHIIHNVYIPAGGEIADRSINEKFGQKLDFIEEMAAMFEKSKQKKTILVGDFNIAPREDDVWDHKRLLNVVSHTPIEIEYLARLKHSGDWVDIIRKDITAGQLYSWWSYRARNWEVSDKGRRLDHIWATSDIAEFAHSSKIVREARGWEKPSDHAPVFVTFDL